MARRIEKGDRVMATTNLSKGVRKGDTGVVLVKFGFATDLYEVSFEGRVCNQLTDRDVALV